MRGFFFLLCAVAFVMVPCLARADMRQWIPKLTGIGAYMEVSGHYRSDKTETDLGTSELKETFIGERLALFGSGYIYHPRFIQLGLSLSVGLQHRNLQSGDAPSDWRTGSWNSYELRAKVLPEHPYNLELWTMRASSSGSDANSTFFSKGAIFTYKNQPYFVTAAYTTTSTEFDTGSSSSTDTYRLSASYFKQYSMQKSLSLAGTYRHSDWRSNLTGTRGSGDEASLSNTITLRNVGIGSSVGIVSSRGGESSATSWYWSENVSARLPYNLAALLNYSLSKGSADRPAPAPELSTTRQSIAFSINHKLYSSLFTGYGVGYTKASSNTGDFTGFSNSFHINYSKNIPWGRLYAAARLSRTTSDSTGSPATTDEAHPGISVPGFFVLGSEDVERSSISIFLINPEVPDERIPLAENVHYLITPLGRTFEIEVLNLPVGVRIPGTYNFVVSYTLSRRDVKITTDNAEYSARLNLFKDILTIYYDHSTYSQTIRSGFIEGGPSDTTTDTVGASAALTPFTLAAEYTNVQSNVNPYSRWVADAVFQKTLSPTTSVRASARYQSTHYPQGTSGRGLPFDTNTATGSAGVSKNFPRAGLQFGLSGSYGRTWGLVSSTTYALNSGLSWNIGKFSLTLGASASFSDSEPGHQVITSSDTGLVSFSSKRSSQYYYLNIKRGLY